MRSKNLTIVFTFSVALKTKRLFDPNRTTADLPCAQQVGGLFVLFYLVNTAFYNSSKAAEINFIPIALVCKLFDLIPIFRDINNCPQYDLLAILTVDCGDPVGLAIPDTAFYSDIKQSIVLSPFLYSTQVIFNCRSERLFSISFDRR